MNKLFYFIGWLFGESLLHGRRNYEKVIFPFYHTISNNELIHIKYLYKVRSIRDFERDLDFFIKNYEPIDYRTFRDNFMGVKLIKKPSFLLTFDDGLREFYDVVAPILLRKGIPAICFLNSGFVDNRDLFFRHKVSILMDALNTSQFSPIHWKHIKKWFEVNKLSIGSEYRSLLRINYLNKDVIDDLARILEFSFEKFLVINQPYLTSEQIRTLIMQGFDFGAHSVDHPLFSSIKENQQLYQIRKSVTDIVEWFDLKYKIFSFPFSDAGLSKAFFDSLYIEHAGLVDFTFGTAGLKDDSCIRNIQRIPIETATFSAKDIVYGEYLYSRLRKVLNKNLIIRL